MQSILRVGATSSSRLLGFMRTKSTLAQLLESQAALTPTGIAISVPQQQVRISYSDLVGQSRKIASGLLELGVERGVTLTLGVGVRVST